MVSQVVVAGLNGNYALSFVAGREEHFTAAEFFVTIANATKGHMETVDLLAAAIPPGNIGGAAGGNPGGTLFSLKLEGVSAGDAISIDGVMTSGMDAGINPQSAFLDSFSLTFSGVPEPGAATVGCLAGLVLMLRRR